MSTEIKKNDFKDYTVAEFVGKYEKFKNDSAKETFLKQSVKFVDYIEFEVVEVICDGILRASCFDNNGNVKIDSCKKYLMYTFCIFDQYTNIQVDKSQWMKEFNMLYKNGLVDVVCQLMPDRLMATLDSILKMKSDDMMTNYYEPHAFIKEQIVKYVPLIHGVTSRFLDGVERISKNIDLNNLVDSLKEGGKND